MSDEQTVDAQEAPKELREARDRAIAQAEEARAELLQFKAATLFEKAGLGQKQAELFLKANPEAEVTNEAVSAFIEDYGFKAAEAPSSKEAAPAPKSAPLDAGLGAFDGAAVPSADGTPAAQPQMSKEDFAQLLVDNPQAAAQAYIDGTAPRNPANVQARQLVKEGIIDH